MPRAQGATSLVPPSAARARALAVLLTAIALAACGRDGDAAHAPRAAAGASAPAANGGGASAAAILDAPLAGSTAGLTWSEMVTGGAGADDRLPMIVAVHGLGGSPDDIARLFDGFPARARVILPRGALPFHGGFAWWLPDASHPSLDGDAAARGIATAAHDLASLVAVIVKQRPTIGAPILTGFSQGGALTYAVAAHHPEVVSAAYPLSGWLPPALRSPIPASSPRPRVDAFHGTSDARVPFAEGRDTLAALTGAGYRAELHGVEGAAHTITAAEREQLLVSWAASVEAMAR